MKLWQRIAVVVVMVSLLAVTIHVAGILANLAILILRFLFDVIQGFIDTTKRQPIVIAYLVLALTVVIMIKKLEGDEE